MKLKELFETNELTTCQYLTQIDVEFKKTKTDHGAIFEFTSIKLAKNMLDELTSVPELTKHFDYGYDGIKSIVVTKRIAK